MDRILKIISKTLAQSISINEIDAPIESFENWDSLAHLIIISEIEKELEVNIPIENYNDIKKISDFSRYINES